MCTDLVSTYGYKNELCPSRSVFVSAHCFTERVMFFLCSVLVLTHRFKNDLLAICVPCLFRLVALRTSHVAC